MIRLLRTTALACLVALAATAPGSAQTAPPQQPQKPAEPAKALSIAGKWTMTMEMSIGTATPALVFKQDGEKITGTYTGRYGTYEFKGTLKDRKLAFSFQMSTDGGDTTMSFTGLVAADAESIKGEGTIDGLGDVTWTAKRNKDGN